MLFMLLVPLKTYAAINTNYFEAHLKEIGAHTNYTINSVEKLVNSNSKLNTIERLKESIATLIPTVIFILRMN